jgi:hypothetical protein
MRITLEEMRTEEDDVSAVVIEDAPDRRHSYAATDIIWKES